MATMRSRITHSSGIPLGGIGTGSVEIRPDGCFHEWQIFNMGLWAPLQPECCKKVSEPAMGPDALTFLVRTGSHSSAGKSDNAPVVRRLGVRADHNDPMVSLYSHAWLRCVEEVEFTGRYPVASLRYSDPDLPVAVSADIFSPMIPHDARISGTPGFYAAFRIKNRTDKPVTASLAGILKNPLAWGAEDRKLRNTIARGNGATFLGMRTEANGECLPTTGSMSFSVTGGAHSWVAGDFEQLFAVYHMWGGSLGNTADNLLHFLRVNGRLPNADGDRSCAGMLLQSEAELERLPFARKKEILRALEFFAIAKLVVERVDAVSPKHISTDKGLTDVLKEIRIRIIHAAGEDRKRQTWGSGALCSSVDLAPLEEKEIRFSLAWHFPHHYSQKGPDMGHMYNNWFKDADEANRFMVSLYDVVAPKVQLFSGTLFDTTLEGEMADAWAGQLTTLPKCTWWVKDGKFGVWEGLGCCGFHTTDISYQGSFNILALYPELQKGQMEMGAAFQREDGRIPHFFYPDLYSVDNGFDRVDMNQQFVLLVCRDYLWTNDRPYVERMWPHIVRAMDNIAALDKDGDGLPDHDTQRNTYDCWNFAGTPSYIASLWLSALLAAIRMAEDLGCKNEAAKWAKILEKGTAAFEKKLWNGEYYSLWVDGKVRDECCMTDQIDGDWFSQLIGVGHALPKGRIVKALKAVMKYNFSPDTGLINASYPPGAKPLFCTYRNLQAEAPWTGIEYAIASMMMEFGLTAEAWKVVKAIHDRYFRAGRFWNHVECGEHYYRAMSSWAILLAATGFKVDMPRKTLTFAPAYDAANFRAPWAASTAWGRFRQAAGLFELECMSGTICFRELRLGRAVRGSCRLNGEQLAAKVMRRDEFHALLFSKDVDLAEGDKLSVELDAQS